MTRYVVAFVTTFTVATLIALASGVGSREVSRPEPLPATNYPEVNCTVVRCVWGRSVPATEGNG